MMQRALLALVQPCLVRALDLSFFASHLRCMVDVDLEIVLSSTSERTRLPRVPCIALAATVQQEVFGAR